MEVGGSRRGAAVVPELNVTVGAQRALLDEMSFVPHEILNRDRFVCKDLEMVTDQVPIFAVRTSYQDRSMMVALFGQAMRRARLADIARESELVGRDLVSVQSRFGGRRRRGRGCAGFEADSGKMKSRP